MNYITKQKEEIINIIKDYNNEFTVKDIYEKLNKKVGLTTIYRLVINLKEQGFLNIRVKDNNHIYYQYIKKCNKDNHFYLKCEKCGLLKHIDCDCVKKLNAHILNEHDFSFNTDKIIINAICSRCK